MVPVWGGSLAVRVLMVLAMLLVFYGCEQETRRPPEEPEKTVVVQRTVVERTVVGERPSAQAQTEADLVGAVEDYYEAVDQENWPYTYASLDSRTKALFTEEEWYQKNEWFAANEGLELSAINVVVDGPASDPEVGVTVYRTFKDGTSITRDTLFVMEDGSWKHRFTEEEIAIFMPGTPYEEFVAAQQASPSASASASPNASPNASSSASPSASPDPDRAVPDLDAPNPRRPRDSAPDRGRGGPCPQGGYPVGPTDPRDGDDDGCAGE
jgi:hypothetical protein